jgi:hypothetical protein
VRILREYRYITCVFTHKTKIILAFKGPVRIKFLKAKDDILHYNLAIVNNYKAILPVIAGPLDHAIEPENFIAVED